MKKQTFAFQAETKELLNLMIHSLYSHREIFLRELISNASDAIEKLKFESLTQKGSFEGSGEGASQATGGNAASGGALDAPFEIRLEADAEKKTLSISDNGIGMSQEEVVENIGTIAHSGTKGFLKAKNELAGKNLNDHPELIGQFGVGFYSAFMVADRVTLHTQKAGTTQGVIWESDGSGSYSLEEAPRPEGHGTTVTLHLKATTQKAEKDTEEDTQGASEDDREELQDFTNPSTLRQVVKKYSDFVAYPIKMKVTKKETKEETKEGQGDGKEEITIDDQTFNTQKALWLRPSSEITKEEYTEFYRHISHDWMEPLKTTHYRAEGTFEFVSIFYVPSQKPFDYNYRDHKVGLSLYIKRVLIKSDCEELVPPYLRFVKGMVDSDDLSLNVSREMLQQDRHILRIKKALTGKILSSLKELIEQDRPGYEKFWVQFGGTLKEGLPTDPSQSEKIKELMLFHTTQEKELTTLKDYISRMKPEQKEIYFITGDQHALVEQSPYLEKPRSKGFEVLLMTDKVDPWIATALDQFQDKPFKSVMAEDLDLDTPEEKEVEKKKLGELEEKLKPLLTSMRLSLKDKVKDIKLSDRMTESPVCLVASQEGMSAHMERLMKSMGQTIPKAKRILEINPGHPLFEKMLSAPPSTQEEWADILYQQALLNEGSQIENPLQYSQKIAKIMMAAL